MVQEFINRQFFRLFTFMLICGIVLFSLIGFDGIDETCAFLLLILLLYSIFKSPEWSVNKVFIRVIGIFIFYTCYSIAIHSNSKAAILKDVIIQFKPYLAFFAVYYLHPTFSKSQKKLLKDCILVIWPFLSVIGLCSLVYPTIIDLTVGHVTFYAGIFTAISLVYLYCSDNSKKEKIIFILIAATGLLSGRSKFYGFFVLSVVMLLFFKSLHQFKFNFKTLSIIIACLGGMTVVAWNKIMLYFGQSIVSDAAEDYTARAVLYIKSIDIFKDFFPFGSGFASFASYSSGLYYSDIYAEYGIDSIDGINKNNFTFIADTYYPCLAQFGVVGVILYILFFLYIIVKAYTLFQKTKIEKYFIIPFLILGYLFIENLADATFTGHRGFFIMMLLGLVLSEQKNMLASSNTNNNPINKRDEEL